MFGKVKRWLGIEGVKLELILPEEVKQKSGLVEGSVRVSSMDEHLVTEISIVLIERYTRGSKNEKLIDEYELGKIVLEQEVNIPANEAVEIDFQLPFSVVKSDMDEIQDRNIIFGGLIKTAKWMTGVKSEYRIEAEASVAGTALNPFDKKIINIT